MSNNNCIGPTNIIPNNNQVVLQDVNRTITIIDNNCCTQVEVTQPVTCVVEILTGPIGPRGEFPTSGSLNLTGSINVSGSITANTIYSPYFTGSFNGNGNGIFSGSFSGSFSANLQDITDNGNTTTLPITASSYYGNGLQIVGDATVTGSLIVSGSNTFKNIGPAQFTGSLDITGSGTLNNYNLLTSNNTGSLLLTSSFNNFTSSYNTGSFTGSFTGIFNGNITSASYALTASYLLGSIESASYATTSSYSNNSITSSYALTASYVANASSFPYTGSAVITGSLIVTGSILSTNGLTGSLFGTSSWSVSSSYALIAKNAISSSYALTASHLNPLNQDVLITGSILLTQSYISTVDYIDFNPNIANPGFLTGRVHWIDDSKTIQIDTDVANFEIEVGHQNVVRGRNITGYTLTKGMIVYINGESGNRPTFTTASWEGDPSSASTLGFVAQDINDNQTGYVVTNGILRGINTNAYSPGTQLYLSSSGQYTSILPLSPKHEVRLGKTITQAVNGYVYVDIMNGYELEEIHDVLITSSSNGDILIKSESVWINSKQLTGSYGLTGSLQANSFTGSLFGTSSYAITASYALSSSYAVTASHALVADSVLGTVTSASYASTSSYSNNFTVQGTLALNGTLTDHTVVNSTIVGSNNLFTQATGSRTSAHGKYTLYNGANARAGEFVTVWNGTSAVYTDYSTVDVGNTNNVEFQSVIVAGDIQINAIAATSGWTIKMLVTYI